jgi:hypothetical protein
MSALIPEQPGPSQELKWVRSQICNGGVCLEVTYDGKSVLLRNSQNPSEIIPLSLAEWLAFIIGVIRGEFDNLVAQITAINYCKRPDCH